MKVEKVREFLNQPSTKRGLAVLLSLAGLAVSPEQADAIFYLVLAALGVYETFRQEKPLFEDKEAGLQVLRPK